MGEAHPLHCKVKDQAADQCRRSCVEVADCPHRSVPICRSSIKLPHIQSVVCGTAMANVTVLAGVEGTVGLPRLPFPTICKLLITQSVPA